MHDDDKADTFPPHVNKNTVRGLPSQLCCHLKQKSEVNKTQQKHFKSSVLFSSCNSPMLWPMMENLLHCRAVEVISHVINPVQSIVIKHWDHFSLKRASQLTHHQQLCAHPSRRTERCTEFQEDDAMSSHDPADPSPHIWSLMETWREDGGNQTLCCAIFFH